MCCVLCCWVDGGVQIILSLNVHAVYTDQLDYVTQWVDTIKSLPAWPLPSSSTAGAAAAASSSSSSSNSPVPALLTNEDWQQKAGYLLEHKEAVALMVKATEQFARHRLRVVPDDGPPHPGLGPRPN